MSNPSKELESIISKYLQGYEAKFMIGGSSGTESIKIILAQSQIEGFIKFLKPLIALREREARIEEWQRIYDHFENLDPKSKMPDVNNPRRSVLIELNELKKGEDL